MKGERVRITDVSPRDGLQNEPGVIPTEEKAELVRLLCETGVDEVEVTSFVSPKWVPQLGDGAQLLALLFPRLFDRLPSRWPHLSALIPNLHGVNSLVKTESQVREQLSRHPKAGIYYDLWPAVPFVDCINLFVAASETFSKRNTNASIEESLARVAEVMRNLDEAPNRVPSEIKAYISCAVACPFEGTIGPHVVASVAHRLGDLGIRSIILGDTIGAADPASIVHLLETFRDRFGRGMLSEQRLTLHLHDTFGRAAECVKVALDMGVRSFDGSVAGLGGCPYASTPGKRAPGNISTQTLVRTIHEAGHTTGVDLDKLEEAGRFATKIVTAARIRAAQAGPETKP